MSRYYLYGLPFLWLVISCPAHGGVIERDWKVAGDGLLTYDNVNQREWLDLSESLLKSFPGDTILDGLQNAILELEPGGMFDEFTFANNDDVLALAFSAGIDTTTFDFERNGTFTANLIQLLSPTVTFIRSNERLLAIGVFNDKLANQSQIFANFFFTPESGPHGASGVFIGETDFTAVGIMLYKHAIPEPMSLPMGVQVILIFMLAKYQPNVLRL